MRIWLTAAAIGLGALALNGCETMSEGQCLSGDWVGQGYRDGQSGQPVGRLDSYAQACAQYGVSPDPDAYHAGWRDGVAQYCRPDNGFRAGRQGEAYHGVCSGPYEREFLSAYEDGRVIHEAEAAVDSARNSLNALASRLQELDEKLDYFGRRARDTSLSDAERGQARQRVDELRGERRSTERDWRRAEDELRYVERRAREVLDSFYGRYRW